MKSVYWHRFLVLVYAFMPPAASQLKNWTNPFQLLDHLTDPSVYDKRARSYEEGGGPIVIRSSMLVYVLGGLATQTMEFTAQILLKYRWEDSRLSYDTYNVSFDHLEGEDWLEAKIWTPLIYIVNEKQSTNVNIPRANVYVSVTPLGVVTYQFRLNLRMFCALDMAKFPFDTEKCTLSLESWSLPVEELQLEWESEGAVHINNDFPLLEFRLLNAFNWKSSTVRERGNFSVLHVDFLLARESGHYLLDYYVPAILLVTLSWVSFWLDPSAIPGRVTIGTSSLLTFITLTRNLGTNMPKISYVKAIDIYSLMCTALIFASLMEFAFVNNIWRRRKQIELRKLDTKHVLKKTLTPNMIRRISTSKSTRSLPMIYSDTASQNELTVTSLSQIESTTQSRQRAFSNPMCTVDRLEEFSASAEKIQSSNQLDSSPAGSQLHLDQPDCVSVSIAVPDLSYCVPSTRKPGSREKQSMDPQEIAKYLDRKSRVFFPAFFLVANVFYWGFIWI